MTERGILFSAPMVRALLDGTKTQTRRSMKHQPSEDIAGPLRCERYHPTVIDRRGDEQPGAEIFGAFDDSGEWGAKCPYGEPGDRLWVREAWCAHSTFNGTRPALIPESKVFYAADDGYSPSGATGRPSIFMPRWASRLTLGITGVRAERVQSISEADAVAEGCKASPFPGPWWQGYRDHDGDLMHQQSIGETPPDWMIEPHKMKSHAFLDRSASDAYRILWMQINGVDSWTENPWVWVVEFRVLPSVVPRALPVEGLLRHAATKQGPE